MYIRAKVRADRVKVGRGKVRVSGFYVRVRIAV